MANISTCMKALLAVSEHITTEDLESLKFLADLAGGQSEKITTPIQFISFVKEQHSNNDETVHYMIKLLDGIQRPRLSQILKKCLVSCEVALERPVRSYVPCHKSHSTLRGLISSNRYGQIVTLVGMVGIGKTELMKQTCVELQDKYLIIQPTEGSDRSKYHDIVKSVHDILRNFSCDVQPEKESIVACLNGLKRDFILSLDISKVPHTQKFCGNVKKFISEIQSIPYCKLILISARYSCKNCQKKENDVLNISLPPFSYEESAVLLMKLLPDLDSDEREKLIDCCQGFPIQSELVAENWPQVLQPSSCLAKINNITVDSAFRTHFDTFTQETKEVLVSLSLIKDEFPVELACAILGIEIQDVISIVGLLTNLQLLLQRGNNYQMPWIVRHYISDMIHKDAGLEKLANKAKKSLIELLVEFLYGMNELFMGYTHKAQCKLFTLLLNGPVNIKFGSCSAIQALGFYRRFELSLHWALKEGTRNKRLGAIEMVADCANECVSFLAKAMEKPTIIFLYETIGRCKIIKRNKMRSASTLVSIAFLKMYHNGCHSESQAIENLLKRALEDLPMNGRFESSSNHFHLGEVVAHCHTKLGHMIAANDPNSFDNGLEMIHKGISIREEEVRRGSGSKALIAAGFVDVAKIYAHQKKYEEAKQYYEKALAIYQQELKVHPFLATTMHCLAPIYMELGDTQKSSLYALLAKNIGIHILGDHLDTARFLQKYADFVAVTNPERAKEIYKYAKRIGENRMEKQELIDIVDKCAELSSGKEATFLRKEADRIKCCAPVDWNRHISVEPFRNKPVSVKKYPVPYGLLLCISVLIVVLSCIFTIPNCRN